MTVGPRCRTCHTPSSPTPRGSGLPALRKLELGVGSLGTGQGCGRCPCQGAGAWEHLELHARWAAAQSLAPTEASLWAWCVCPAGEPGGPPHRGDTCPVSCRTTHWKQVLFMMDEPVSVLSGDVVTGSVVLQRNPVWRRHMSVALSWSVTSTQDPTSQKVRLVPQGGCWALVLGDGPGGRGATASASRACAAFSSSSREVGAVIGRTGNGGRKVSLRAGAQPRGTLPVCRRPRWRAGRAAVPTPGAGRQRGHDGSPLVSYLFCANFMSKS